MKDLPSANTPPSRALLTFSSGGWVLALAALITLLAAAWSVQYVVKGFQHRAVGDGKHPETYGFDLRNCRVDRALLVGSGMPRDGKKVLNHPEMITVGQLAERRQKDPHDKYLVPSDRVVGVEIAGQARAYPIQILNVHEIIQDEIAGVPIAVTFSPPCDSVVVFDRRLNGQTLDFGFSGLLYNSNLVMYDKQADPRISSLWSQLGMRAIAGPAAQSNGVKYSTDLTRGPETAGRGQLSALGFPTGKFELTNWESWKTRHPQTKVVLRQPQDKERYENHRMLPEEYYYTDQLAFPVSPLPPKGEMFYKSRCLIVISGGERKVYPIPAITRRAEAEGRWLTKQGTARLCFQSEPISQTARVDLEGPGVPSLAIYSFWFAWYAQHPDDLMFQSP